MKNFTKCTVAICLMAVAISLTAQSGLINGGDRNFKRFDFQKAAERYKAAADKNKNDLTIAAKLARTYVILEDHQNAEAIYATMSKNPNGQGIYKLYYGMELRSNGKYDEAAKAFADFATAMPNDMRAKELNTGADKIKALAADSKIYEINNLNAINSPASDMGATFYKNGILFSSNKGSDHVIPRQDVWTSHRFYDMYQATSETATPKRWNGKQPNRKFHEGPAVFSADGKEMFFTRSNYVKSKAKRSNDNIIKLKIFHADWNDTKKSWDNIRELNINNNEYSVGHPALSKDGLRLFFISDMPGGYGETDLYVSYKEPSGSWGPAINLGKGVNTPGREMFPYIATDGTLYFSSDSRVGLGGLDVYGATFTEGAWGNVQNVGYPINTQSDDFGYVINEDNTKGYFVSNRAGGKGDDDIYKFTKTGISLCGTVVDVRTKDALPGSTVKLLNNGNEIATATAGAKGDFCFPVIPNHEYKVNATNTDYESNGVKVTMGMGNQIIQIPLTKPGGIDLTVCAVKKGSGTLVGATIEVTNKYSGAKKTCVIDADCKCKFDLEPNTDYTICAIKESENANGRYDKPCKDITTKGKTAPASIFETLEVTYVEEGMVFKIENLYYDLNKWNIRPDAAVQLAKVKELMEKFPTMQIELSSHTDCRATMKYNDELSAKRAKSCVDWLVANGIAAPRMISAGYGERKLVNSCACEGAVKSTCTEAQHQENRRTEVKILKIK